MNSSHSFYILLAPTLNGMKRVFTIFFFLISAFNYSYSQKDSLSVQLFAEGYASSVPNNPTNKTRPAFFYNYTKANNAGINLALGKIHYSSGRFRTNLGLMAGDYAKANLANEEKWARYIYEASAGYKLSNEYNAWIDAGVLSSHIGFESPVGKDNWAATRSIVADNSPYYETGIRISARPNERWYLAMLTLTGWQTISVPTNQLGSHWGMQIMFSPSSKWTFNSSSFIGKVYAGRNLTRIYSNLYTTCSITDKAALTLGWDMGLQENYSDSRRTDVWNDLIGILQYRFKPGKWSAALRYERMMDKNNLLFSLPGNSDYRFDVNHASVNLDWQPVKNLLLRAEANYLQSPYALFFKGDQLVTKQFSAIVIASYNLQFSRKGAEPN